MIAQKNHPLVDNLFSLMSKYLKDVNVSHLTADKVDPQFSFYTVTKATLQVYRLVKCFKRYISWLLMIDLYKSIVSCITLELCTELELLNGYFCYVYL